MSKPKRGSVLDVVLPGCSQRCSAEHQEWYVVFRDHVGDHVHLLCFWFLKPCGISPQGLHCSGTYCSCATALKNSCRVLATSLSGIPKILFYSLFMVETDKYRMCLIFKHADQNTKQIYIWFINNINIWYTRESFPLFNLLRLPLFICKCSNLCFLHFPFLFRWPDSQCLLAQKRTII